MSTPKIGDRVRVVIEGEVVDLTSVGAGSRDVTVWVIGAADGRRNWINPNAEHVKSVEILPPPVETFGPGDVIKHKSTGEIIATTEAGYRWLRCVASPEVEGEFFTSTDARTSKHWKRVTW